jgi:hypothetical protein
MMFKIVCDYCGEDIVFSDLNQKPETCHNCNSFLGDMEVLQLSSEVEKKGGNEEQNEDVPAEGLTLVYQKTGEEIHINHESTIIIGRENAGREVLGKIPQISRKHCAIECVNDQYSVTDLGSLNGTYAGISRIDCKLNPGQVIEDSTLLFLGREPFLVKLKTGPHEAEKDMETDIVGAETGSSSVRVGHGFRCKSCGAEFDKSDPICPKCQTYGSLEPF